MFHMMHYKDTFDKKNYGNYEDSQHTFIMFLIDWYELYCP